MGVNHLVLSQCRSRHLVYNRKIRSEVFFKIKRTQRVLIDKILVYNFWYFANSE